MVRGLQLLLWRAIAECELPLSAGLPRAGVVQTEGHGGKFKKLPLKVKNAVSNLITSNGGNCHPAGKVDLL